ncbi:MAG: Glu-tRNA(Gln) amidotransferase subunit GatE [Candidatus Aenigmatarchaeota archaeon]
MVSMTDYKKIGFKCGVEIHNRLDTKTKLFCGCKPRFSKEKPLAIVKRKLRAVAGEMGQVDVAALYEYLKDRTFFYQCYPEETCLICIDEEPPKSVNKDALEIVLQIAKMLKAEIPEEMHVMRKTVVDGSNTCAFQRTAIVGLNGVLKTSQGDVGITNICLEEESAGKVKKDGNELTYRLDRLGIPLVEIGTAPDIKSPEHAKEVAEKIGMIVRSTGKSQRGIGVTREDVNVSIRGGARVEIKGVQELDMIPQLIENEIKRQQELIRKGETPKEETRVAQDNGTTKFTRPLPGGERMYPETDAETIMITKEMISKIKIPETWEQKAKKFKKVLPDGMVDQILKSEYLDLFETLYKKYDPVLAANTLTSTIKDLRRNGIDTDNITDDNLENLLSSVKDKKISKEAIPQVLENLCKDNVSVDEAIAKSGLKAMDQDQLRKLIKDIIKKHPDLANEKRFAPLMGEIMKEVRGKIGGDIVSKVLKEELG